jgi:hypothetical protein
VSFSGGNHSFLRGLLLAEAAYGGNAMKTELTTRKHEKQSGRVLVPAILYFAGVPFGVVLLLWFFFFRG